VFDGAAAAAPEELVRQSRCREAGGSGREERLRPRYLLAGSPLDDRLFESAHLCTWLAAAGLPET